MSAEDLLHLKRSVSDLNVWEIYPDFDLVTFFFETDEQLAQSADNGARRTCETLYRSVLSRYDEFGYFRKRPIEYHFIPIRDSIASTTIGPTGRAASVCSSSSRDHPR